jgi:hypothetical protein
VKHGVNHDDIRIQSIDAWRKHSVEPDPTKQSIAQSTKPICRNPKEKLQEVRTWNFGNTMPHQGGWGFGGRLLRTRYSNALYVLGIEVDFVSMVPDQPFEQFG